MKKAVVLFAVILMTFSLCACSSGSDSAEGSTTAKETETTQRVTYSWPKEDWLKRVPKYSAGDIVYAQASTASTIGIDATTYEDFTAYVEKLRKKGFTFYDAGVDLASDSCELKDGLTVWTGSDGTMYIMLKYIDSDSEIYENYGCNVRIYSYTQKPTSWK